MANPWTAGFIGVGLLLIAGVALYYNSSTILKAPKKGQLCLRNLPKNLLWMLYINPKDFNKVESVVRKDELKDAGDYYGAYDEEDEPRNEMTKSFRLSMEASIAVELNFGDDKGRLGTVVDYNTYVAMHDLVTAHFDELSKNAPLKGMRVYSSRDSMTAFPLNDWDNNPKDMADDLGNELIDGRLLCHRWKEGDKLRDMTCLTYFAVDEDKESRIRVNYDIETGKKYTAKILARYYKEVKAAKSKDGCIVAIVRCIRAIHVLHPFRDANGRLHCQILLNKFLLEQGFGPSILPYQGSACSGVPSRWRSSA